MADSNDAGTAAMPEAAATNAGGNSTGGGAGPCAPPSGTPVVLATAPRPWGLAVDSMFVYWATQLQGPLYRTPIGGGPATALGSQGTFNLTIDAKNVYSISGGQVQVCAKTGCGGGPTNLGPSGVGNPYGVAVDDTHVYWATTGANTVESMPLAGGSASVLATSAYPYGIAVDATSVYFTSQTTGSVEKVPKTGGTPVTLAAGFDGTWVVAVDASNAYFTAAKGGKGLVMQVPIGGGTPVTLVAEAGEELVALAVDATAVYWADGLSQTVRRVKIGGGCVVTLASGQNGPNGITLDNDNVYWTNVDGNSVMKVAK